MLSALDDKYSLSLNGTGTNKSIKKINTLPAHTKVTEATCVSWYYSLMLRVTKTFEIVCFLVKDFGFSPAFTCIHCIYMN